MINLSFSEISSLFVTRKPASVSLCPLKNFVPLCITTSAPRSSGVWKYGDKNVLSTINNRLCLFAMAETFLISITRIIGLVGVSI